MSAAEKVPTEYAAAIRADGTVEDNGEIIGYWFASSAYPGDLMLCLRVRVRGRNSRRPRRPRRRAARRHTMSAGRYRTIVADPPWPLVEHIALDVERPEGVTSGP